MHSGMWRQMGNISVSEDKKSIGMRCLANGIVTLECSNSQDSTFRACCYTAVFFKILGRLLTRSHELKGNGLFRKSKHGF